jgi:hypothetical protein
VQRQYAAAWVSLCVSAVILVGCSTAPVQKPTQTVAPDSSAAASLKDVQAQVVKLSQQNETIINAVQKSAQDADAFRLETKGGIASLTQCQFRLESWLAEASDGDRVRSLGIVPYPAPGQAGPQLVVGPDRRPGGAVPDARSAGAGADAEKPVLSGQWPVASDRKWRPTMLELLIAFIVGAAIPIIALLVALRRHSAAIEAYETKISVIENNFIARVEALIQRIEGKPAAPFAPHTPAAPKT